jgi:adenylate cyclase
LTVTEMPEGKRAVRLSLGDLHDPVMIALKERMQGWDGKKFRMIIHANSKSYLIHVDPVSDGLMDEQYLAVAAPLKDFTGKMDKTREQSLLFAVVIILLAVPLAVYNARLMSKPLNTLAVEADKIRHFDLDSRVDVQSHIAEIAGLSKAVKAMQMSLSSFGRYVPKTLVERLLLAGKSPELGGERREATLLFTDIADFTTISESMGAEELMLTVSEYLQEVGSVIISHGGTIDKYIGDSIMAFWNAPNSQENHAALACEAALQACAVSEAINARWELQGKPVMHTRFGLHTGRPVIGNVGSDDRMNYTAMGAAVNLASRLEGLNKYYGTQILVSEAVKEQAGEDFMFRPVGKVLPKGTVSPVIAYELMGYSGVCTGIVTPDGRDTCFLELWERGYAAYQDLRFSEAAEIFKTCFDVKPEDHLAASMMQRAVYLAENSPEDDWDGVDVFKVK